MALAIPDPTTIINSLSGAIAGVPNMCDYIADQLVSAGWTKTFFNYGVDLRNPNASNFVAGDSVTLAGQTYTWEVALGGAGDILIGADARASMTNLMNAVNGGPGSGTTWDAATPLNPLVKAGPVWEVPTLTLTIQTKSGLQWAAPILAVSEAITDGNIVFSRSTLVVAGWMCDSATDQSGNKVRLYVLDGAEQAFVQQVRLSIGNQEMTVRSTDLPPNAQPFNNSFGVRLLISAQPWRINAHQYGILCIEDGVGASATSTNFFGYGVVAVDDALLPPNITGVANNGGFVQITIDADVGWSTTDLICIRGNTGWSMGDNINRQTVITRDSALVYTTDLLFIGPYSPDGKAAGANTISEAGQVVEAVWGCTGATTATFLRAILSVKTGGVGQQLVNGYTFQFTNGVGNFAFGPPTNAVKSDNNPVLAYGGSVIGGEPNMLAYNTSAVAARYLGKAYGMFITGQATLLDTPGTFQGYNWVNYTDSNSGSGSATQGSVYVILP